jgi:BirA family transcriptional regulator, biotin operon repressor / biotin---[acetyl-CoA-carboxylase] ligase
MDTLFIGQELITLDSIASTNEYAKTICKNNLISDGAVIWAKEQFAGKGQRGNVWQAEPGKNLTFTIVLKPFFLKVTEQYFLNAAIAVGVQLYLQKKLKHKVEIKWPNDILIEKEKIAGILIENILSGNNIQYSIVGIGININQINFPDSIRATSLLLKKNEKLFSLEKELKSVCSSIEQIYLRFRTNPASIMDEYKKHLFGLQQEMLFIYKGSTIKASIFDVSKEGRLMLKKDTGTIISADNKEIRFLY